MSDHLERMKVELEELKEKQIKLNSFMLETEVFEALCELEQARMIKQSGFMADYAKVLDERILVAGRYFSAPW